MSTALALLLAAAPTIGMNGHLPSAADSLSMKNLGVSAVRMDFNWFDFEPAQGAKSFAYLDPIVDAARLQGLKIYASVGYTPQWASSAPGCVLHSPDENLRCDNKRPATTAAWTSAVTAVVTHFQGKVECWGIWNEPNLRGFFDGSMQQFVDEIFVPAAAAIRAADPNARICGPELAGLTQSSHWNGNNGTCIAGSCIRNGWELDLGQVLDRVGGSIDVVTQHFYKSNADGLVTAMIDGEYFGTLLTHDSLKHVLATHGAAGKEVWLTETGWEHPPQGGTSLADVATQIVAMYSREEDVCSGAIATSTNDPWPNWTRTYYFHFPYDPGSGWGLVDMTGAPLQPYTALQTWAQGRTTTACGLGGTGGGSGAGGGAAGGSAGGASGGGSAGGATAGGAGTAGGATAGGIGSAGGSSAAGGNAAGGNAAGGSAGGAGGAGASAGGGQSGGPTVEEPGSCGCNTGITPLLLALLAFTSRRRRRG